MEDTQNIYEEMMKLRNDPEAFEKLRAELIEQAIRSAPGRIQLKLRAVQAKFDKRMRTATSQENRLALSYMMMMDLFIEQFNPAIQDVSQRLKELWKEVNIPEGKEPTPESTT